MIAIGDRVYQATSIKLVGTVRAVEGSCASVVVWDDGTAGLVNNCHLVVASHNARDPLSFVQLRSINVARCEAAFRGLHEWTPSDYAMATTGEWGEACNALKKMLRGDVGGPDLQDVADELADTITYLDLLAARLGIDLGAAVRRKFNIVSDRKACSIRLPDRVDEGET